VAGNIFVFFSKQRAEGSSYSILMARGKKGRFRPAERSSSFRFARLSIQRKKSFAKNIDDIFALFFQGMAAGFT